MIKIASCFFSANLSSWFGEFNMQQLSHDGGLRFPAKYPMPGIPIVVVTMFAVSFDDNQISKARDRCHHHRLVEYGIPLDLVLFACVAEEESKWCTGFGPVNISVRPTIQAGHIVDGMCAEGPLNHFLQVSW